MRIKLQIWIGLVCVAASVFHAKAQQRPVTIEDCIEMVRIQQTYDANDATAVFSPDGRQFVTMI